jgi:uncharacterized oligopeptide transporter (OPT) family protein
MTENGEASPPHGHPQGAPPQGGRPGLPTALAAVAVGTVLALGNLTVGLASGLWDSGQVTASLLAFLALSLFGRGQARSTQLVQGFACAAGAMPAVLGLLGVVPALRGLGLMPPLLPLLAAGLLLGGLGLWLALLLHQRLIVEEALPFPSGAAAAELISTLHAGAGADGGETRARARALLGGGAAAALVVVLRDGLTSVLAPVLPGALLLPGTLFGVPCAALGLGVAVGPLLAGIGAVAGLPVGLSIGLGALLGQAGLGRHLLASGLRTEANLGEWLVWPGVALIVAASAVDLLWMAPALLRGGRDLAAARTGSGSAPRRSALAVALFVAPAVLLYLWSAGTAFGLRLPEALFALAAAPLFCAVVARAAGQADFAPISQAGQAAQTGAGLLLRLDVPRDIGVGAVVSGAAAQTGTVLWSMKSGERLGTPLRAQGLAALAGTCFGALVSLAGFLVLERSGALGGARFPAPSAAQFKAVAALVVAGGEAVPAAIRTWSAAAALLGVLLALAGRTRLARVLPSAVAMGVGVLIPFSAGMAVLLGSAAAWGWQRVSPRGAALRLAAVGAGLIAGESLVAFALAALGALR